MLNILNPSVNSGEDRSSESRDSSDRSDSSSEDRSDKKMEDRPGTTKRKRSDLSHDRWLARKMNMVPYTATKVYCNSNK